MLSITFSGDFEGDLEIFGILFIFPTLTGLATEVVPLLSFGGEGEGRLASVDDEPEFSVGRFLASEVDEPEFPS